MDSSENERYKMDHYKRAHHQWSMMPQHQVKKPNALAMNKKIMAILTERDTAIRELNIALAEKKEALAARDEALKQRDEALAQLDTALMERDNAIAALRIQDHSANLSYSSSEHGANRIHHSSHLANVTEAPYNMHITDALPITEISSEAVKSSQRKRAKNVGEGLYRQVSPEGKKYRSEWESQDAGLNIVNFDETTMPTPVCSCTGVPRLCYKWGNGGWQSSCCTTAMSVYPLPQMPNKRHARVGGRKMSGSVFTRLLSRLVAEGHDLSLPVDLKDYWARHGTNRYITIK